MRLGSAKSVGLVGLKAFIIHAQAFISPGLPYFSIIGLPDTSLSESRERVKSACSACGFRWPQTRVTVNLSPASRPKHGSSHDLAIAISVLGAGGLLPVNEEENIIALGELNLDGTVLPITGVLPILSYARQEGVERVFLPQANLEEAGIVPDIEVRGLRHLGELVNQLNGSDRCKVRDGLWKGKREREISPLIGKESSPPTPDMNEVVGQEETKSVLTVAAAGGHHMLMVGPPGSGKSMLATRLPGILPHLTKKEQLEVASIRSLCGTLSQFGVSDLPPFEAPHHTASAASLVGGGTGLAMPGAITKAHRGVLFMDEAPEFSPRVLQSLREPLEVGEIFLSRSRGSISYPASFQLIMAANPCPCGFGYGTGEHCTCTARERTRYWSRISGPIMDRIDIQTIVPPVSHLGNPDQKQGQSSMEIRARVTEARELARDRFARQGWSCNAQISGEWLRANTPNRVMAIVNVALQKQGLSLRGADRSLRLAWTLADLDGRTCPEPDHISAGILMRTKAG